MEQLNREPKILVVDIETSPIIAYTWGPKWETNIIESIQESQILSFCAKWLNGKTIVKAITDYRGYKKGELDDSKLMADLHKLFDDADVVVTQNGNKFDIKVINSRFLKHGFQPPSPYKMVDTMLEAKKYLRLPSYSLDDMCEYFGIGRKIKHEGFGLWKKCMEGNRSAWRKMKEYNKHDVILTEEFYLKLRPFMRTHPNFSTFSDQHSCPKCNSTNVQSRGYARNSTTAYKRAQCQDCGGWFRYGANIQKLENKKMHV